MYSYLFILIAVLIPTGYSTIVKGPCPIKVTSIQSFNTTKYLGQWYDLYVDKNQWICEDNLNCTITRYTSYIEEKHTLNGFHFFVDKYKNTCGLGLWQCDYDVDAKLFTRSDGSPIYILDTDYENYAVEIGCFKTDKPDTHDQRTIIRSRIRSMDNDLLNKLKQKVVDFGFLEPNLVAQDYSTCPDDIKPPW